MVNILQEGWVDNNFDSPGGSAQFGPYESAAAVSRLLRVRATFALTAPGVSLAPTAEVRDQVAWGVQFGTVDYSPLVLPADISGSNFLWSELLAGPTADAGAFVPSDSDFGWVVTRVATREWRGQLPVGVNVDFYVTAGLIVEDGQPFAAAITLEVDFSY